MSARVKEVPDRQHHIESSQYLIETVSRSPGGPTELLTFSVAVGEVDVMPEYLLDEDIAAPMKSSTEALLRDLRMNQLPVFGSETRCRVYKVLKTDHSVPTVPLATETRTIVLEPLFDLDSQHRPVRCVD